MSISKKRNAIIIVLLFLISIIILFSYILSKNKEKDYVGKLALVVSTDYKIDKSVFPKDKEDIKTPKDVSVGEVAYIRSIYKDYAYVDLMRPMQVYAEINSGYIHLNNLKVDYSNEEISSICQYCCIKDDKVKGYNEPNGRVVEEQILNHYAYILEKKDNWVKVGFPGGVDNLWVRSEDIDYDFSEFAENMKDFKFKPETE